MNNDNITNPDVLAYLNRFIRCKDMTIEDATN